MVCCTDRGCTSSGGGGSRAKVLRAGTAVKALASTQKFNRTQCDRKLDALHDIV